MKQVSIIMLAYNRALSMTKTVDCALAQEDVDFEFILVDNGSDSVTGKVCEELVEKYPEIIFIRRENSNIGAGRNAGIEAASGEFITFVDDDDYFECDMMSFLYKNAMKKEADISICGCYYDFTGVYQDYYIYDEEYCYNCEDGVTELLKREKYNAANPCKLFRKSLFSQVKYNEKAKFDDIHTIYRLFAESRITITSGVPKYYFVKHDTNNSGFLESNQLTDEILKEYFSAFYERTKYLSKKFPNRETYYRYTEWSYMISMVNKIAENDLSKQCENQLAFAKKVLLDNFDEFSNSPYLKEFESGLLEKYFHQ